MQEYTSQYLILFHFMYHSLYGMHIQFVNKNSLFMVQVFFYVRGYFAYQVQGFAVEVDLILHPAKLIDSY